MKQIISNVDREKAFELMSDKNTSLDDQIILSQMFCEEEIE